MPPLYIAFLVEAPWDQWGEGALLDSACHLNKGNSHKEHQEQRETLVCEFLTRFYSLADAEQPEQNFFQQFKQKKTRVTSRKCVSNPVNRYGFVI
jgi:hypothetical protein